MTLEDLLKSATAFDSGWTVMALLIILLFVLAWRFGNELLALMKENTAVTKQAHAEAKNISESIVTNHGSKNLGDAVDRLYEQNVAIMARLEKVELDQAVIHRLFSITRAPE